MIVKEIFYGVKCNRCGKFYSADDGHAFFQTESEATEFVVESEWMEIKREGKHYCPDCLMQDSKGKPCPRGRHFRDRRAYIARGLHGIRCLHSQAQERTPLERSHRHFPRHRNDRGNPSEITMPQQIKTIEKIQQAICKECPDAKYTVGYRRVLLCSEDCWIRKAIKNTETKQ